jgi:hypothetical protein
VGPTANLGYQAIAKHTIDIILGVWLQFAGILSCPRDKVEVVRARVASARASLVSGAIYRMLAAPYMQAKARRLRLLW